MSRFHDLLARVADESVRNALKDEYDQSTKHKKFGLVFEEHLPECTPLWGMKIRRGMLVARKGGDFNDIHQVQRIKDGLATCWHPATKENIEIPIDDLIPIARFGDPIYPVLTPVDAVENAPGDKLWHALIQADNYHALQLLEYLYEGKVDCIYIDPPYNSGAHDWKYNNDYVDDNDIYRHSKWLSMMQKRLRLAKKLLNPKDSVLIVTIDEKEYLHLGMLLEEMFKEARIQMVTSVISAKGVVRAGQFSRVEEYVYIVEFGASEACHIEYNMLDGEVKKSSDREIEWLGFRRRAPQAKRASRPNQFYPIYVDKSTGFIHSIGDVVPHGVDRNTVAVPDGCVALWPLSKDGDERLWSLIPSVARENWKNGYLRVKNWDVENGTGTVYYLASGTIADIQDGTAQVVGKEADGAVVATYSSVGTTPPKRVWNMKSHNAETYGTNLIQGMIGNRFTYPKSLYAEHDAIRFFVANKPNALIVDFFAGSGTTLHAVNLLNAEDGGKRQCIIVTNNEVSEAESKAFRARGISPGDAEWEARGIAQYVTWPRTKCSIKGVNVDGEPLKGEYITAKGGVLGDRPLPMAEGFKANAAFFKLEFADKDHVALGKQFKELLPILWMKSGARGKRPTVTQQTPPMLVLPENEFAVLTNEAAFLDFEEQVKENPEIEDIYLVTDSNNAFKEMSLHFKDKRCIQLYRDYLDNFRINKGGR